MKKDMFADWAFAASDPKATTKSAASAHKHGASDFADMSSSRQIVFFVTSPTRRAQHYSVLCSGKPNVP
jgi:hypothetical protein